MPDNTIVSALFPLPNLVFFPNTLLPLHIFEPRYVKMTEDAIEGDRVITVVQLRPGWEEKYMGEPPIYEIATAGHVSRYVRQDDGRYDIILDGFSRVRIVEEEEGDETPYRRATCELLDDSCADSGNEIGKLTNQLSAQCLRLLELRPSLASWGKKVLYSVSDPGAFSNLLAAFYGAAFQIDPYERQCILDADEIVHRMKLVSVQGNRILKVLNEE